MKTIRLTNEEIDRTTEELIQYFSSKDIEKREITRNRLIVEEVLNKFRDRFGEDAQVNVTFSAILNQVRCKVSLAGPGLGTHDIDQCIPRIRNGRSKYLLPPVRNNHRNLRQT